METPPEAAPVDLPAWPVAAHRRQRSAWETALICMAALGFALLLYVASVGPVGMVVDMIGWDFGDGGTIVLVSTLNPTFGEIVGIQNAIYAEEACTRLYYPLMQLCNLYPSLAEAYNMYLNLWGVYLLFRPASQSPDQGPPRSP
ncbi:hypothetical protein DB346_17045 [Verrucomicrobia bacterium LW23]|nr:hypothetical protein DB346_17045 [Verrucomicrobia bacterium LW23]